MLWARCCLQASPCVDVLLGFGTAWLGSSAARRALCYPRGCLRSHSAAVSISAAAQAVRGTSLEHNHFVSEGAKPRGVS